MLCALQVTLDTEGQIVQSSCDCPMKNFKCSHVAAALLFGFKNASKTDVKCSWLKHPKSAPPKQTSTIDELFPTSKPHFR